MFSASPAPPVTRAAAVRDISIQLVGRIANLALGVVVTIVTVRTLGVQGNGQWATLLAGVAIVGNIGQFGMESVAVRKAAADPAETANWLGALLVMRIVFSVPAFALALLLAILEFHTSEIRIAGLLVAATLLAGAPACLLVAFQLQTRNDRSIVVMTVQSLIWAAAVGFVAVEHGRLIAFAAALLLTTVLTGALAAGWVIRGGQVALRGARRHARELVTIGFVLGVGSTLTFAYGKVDQLLVQHYTGSHGAGIYGTAYMLLDRVQFLPAAIMTTMFPLLSAAWPANPDRARRLVQQVIEAMALISVPAVAFTAVAGRPLIVLLFGEPFAPSAAVLPVLMLAFVSTCFGYLVGYLAVIVDRQRAFVRIASIALVFNIAANVVLIPRYGYLAAAWVTVATEVVVITQAVRVALSPLQMTFKPGRLPNAILAAALMALFVYVADRAGVGAIGLGAIAGVTYPVAVVLCGGLAPEDRAAVIRKLRRSK
jgi:O-antigen/teichoic acid export membrane protein